MRKTSLINEEARQLRVLEVAAGAFSSRIVEDARSTTDGNFEDTTDGVRTREGGGSGKPDPPTC